MRKVIVCNVMSVDGYFAGEGGNVMAVFAGGPPDAYFVERLNAADTLLLGRLSYEGFLGYWPDRQFADDATEDERQVSRRDNEIEKVVISDSLTADQTAPWTETTTIVPRAQAHERVAELKRRPGGDILVFASHVLWNDLFEQGLVDEIHLIVSPVVAGAGVPVFENITPAELELIEVRELEGVQNVVLRYGVRQNT